MKKNEYNVRNKTKSVGKAGEERVSVGRIEN